MQSTFPIALESYPSLYQLDLDNTSMSGTLPDVPQGGFSQLLALYAANNELTGSIPDSWQNTALFALVRFGCSQSCHAMSSLHFPAVHKST